MLGSEKKVSSSGTTSSDMPPLPQCLPLDPITLGNKKYTRSGELRKVLGVPVGSTSEDHSPGIPHPKPIAPVASGAKALQRKRARYLQKGKAESRSAATLRQQDGNLIQTLGGSSVRMEEKTRRLLAGGEGLDHKIKKKRSVGAVGKSYRW